MENQALAIDVKNITKDYDLGRVTIKVLRGISLTVQAGELAIIYGASGSGKSTLLGLIGGLESPTTGSIGINGQEIAKLKSKEAAAFRRANIGIVFQQFNLVPTLNSEDNVALPLMLARVGRGEALRRAREILKLVGLSERAKHKPSELSGGEQQRIAIGRAIITNPPVLLVDEPTGNLDSENGRTVIDIIRKIHSWGTTIVLVTHNRDYAKYGSRIYSMADGRVTGSVMGQAAKWRDRESGPKMFRYEIKKCSGGLRWWEVLRVAKSHFLSNRLRVFFTTMGVTLGIGSIVALVSLGVGLQRITSEQMASFNALVTITVSKIPTSAQPLDDAAADKIKKLEHIKMVSPEVTMTARGTLDGTTTSLMLTGLREGSYDFADVKIIEGDAKGIVINKATAKSYNIQDYKSMIGKKMALELVPIPAEGEGDSDALKQLLAAAEKPTQLTMAISGVSDDELIAAVYVPLGEVMTAAGMKEFTSIKVKMEDRQYVKGARGPIEDMGYATSSVVDMIDQVDKVFTIVQVALGLIGAIALLVALIGIINTMTIALLERTREIGILKAIGASNADIRRLFSYESALFGFVGGVFGVGVAWLAGQGVNTLVDYMVRAAGSNESVHIFATPRLFAIAMVIISVFVAMLAGWYPSRRAAKLSAMEALRYE